jgi:hypothetical protein
VVLELRDGLGTLLSSWGLPAGGESGQAPRDDIEVKGMNHGIVEAENPVRSVRPELVEGQEVSVHPSTGSGRTVISARRIVVFSTPL